jgi:citrate lyase subunit beta/citryl-CoA lyase
MRSLLFIPGDDEKKLRKGMASGADALILDLEDSVSAARKEAAREITRQYLFATRTLEKRPLLYVRINALDTAGWEGDLTGIRSRSRCITRRSAPGSRRAQLPSWRW